MTASAAESSVRALGWGAAAVVGLALILPIGSVLLATFPMVGADQQLAAYAGTALNLPIYVYLVRCAAYGRRPAHGGFLLGAMAAAVVVTTPLVGTLWQPSLAALALAGLIVLPAPWSALGFGVLLLAQFPLESVSGVPGSGLIASLFVSKALALAGLLRLLDVTRRLHAARVLLAASAVARERSRIDDDLRRTVGADLADVAARAVRLESGAGHDPAAMQLRELVTRSRHALARARRTTSAYQQPTVRGALDTAVALLGAAGVDVRVEAPSPLPVASDDFRAQLRAATAAALRDGGPRRCVLVVAVGSGRVELDIRPEDGGPDPRDAGRRAAA